MTTIDLRLPTESTIGRSGQEASCRLINGYAEVLGADLDGKSVFAIYADPGLTRFSTDVRVLPSRGMILLDDDSLICILGTQLVEFGTDGTSSSVVNVPGVDNVTMARNMNATPQIGIVTDGGSYYLLSGATLTTPTTGFSAPNSICYLKGKFVFTTSAGMIFHSAADDGTTFNALSYDYANSDPDGIVRVVEHVGYLFVFGKKSLEVWQDVGTSPFAFAPMQQYIPHGLLAKYSVAQNDKGLFWVDHRGIVRRGRDQNAVRISTHSIERAIDALSDAERADIRGTYFSAQGHEWYVLSSDYWSWWYNIQAERWHEHISYGDVRWIADQAIWFNGNWIVSDYRNGTLYTIATDEYTEDTSEFTLEVWCPHVHDFPRAVIADRLSLDVISGFGLESGDTQNTNPQITVDFSDNGGKTFKGERVASIGASGDYNKLVSLNQWGRIAQKGRIWRIRGTSATLRGLIQAKLDVRSAF